MRAFAVLLGLSTIVCLRAGTEWPRRPATVAALVAAAMADNLALRSEGMDVELALAKLQEARSFYQPRLNLAARYTLADGGRTIDLPIGDLLNPAYDALNRLLAAQGQAGSFPRVSNESIAFLRGHEQETKLTLQQPLYQPAIHRGVKARRAQWESREAMLAQFRRELRLQVETGYCRWVQAESAVAILQSAAEVTAEALRVNRSLFSAEKITEDRVLRAEADDLEVQQQRVEADRDRTLARAYLNFLMNRPLTTPILRASEGEESAYVAAVRSIELPSTLSIEGREELLALKKAVEAAKFAESAEKARQYPSLAFAAEGGIQGERYGTGRGFDYGMASLVAQVNLWDGRERRVSQQQAHLQRAKLELQWEQTRQQLLLDAQRALDELRAALAACQTAERREAASERAFYLVSRREREGLANQLTFLDARSESTRAQLNAEITRQRLLVAFASLDRAIAVSPLP